MVNKLISLLLFFNFANCLQLKDLNLGDIKLPQNEQPELQPQPQQQQEAPIAQDIDVESGNWYEKLQWWKKAKPVYESVKENVNQIRDIVQSIDQKVDQGRKAVTELYSQLRINPQTIDADINKFLGEIKKQLEVEPQNEKEMQANIQRADTQKILESLKDNLLIADAFKSQFNKSIDDIIRSQLTLAESYVDRSLENFEKIENTLDDQKARYLFEEIESYNQNSKNILNYFAGTLLPYAESSIIKIKQLTAVIEKSLVDAEKNNIILRPKSPEELKKEAAAKAVKEQEAQKLGWFGSIWNAIKSFFVGIWNWIKSWFVKA